MRRRDTETAQVTLQRRWATLEQTAELRRAAAQRLLEHLIAAVPPTIRGTDLLAETTLGKLLAAITSEETMSSRAKDPRKLMDRALLWLHEQRSRSANESTKRAVGHQWVRS